MPRPLAIPTRHEGAESTTDSATARDSAIASSVDGDVARPEHRAVLGTISVLYGLGDFLADVGEDAARGAAQGFGGEGGANGLRRGQ